MSVYIYFLAEYKVSIYPFQFKYKKHQTKKIKNLKILDKTHVEFNNYSKTLTGL